jgi:pimeloyl-ACP methyl ester carboxylesterase
MTDAIRPFHLHISDEQLADLHRRLDHTRWPEAETVDDTSQGAPLAKVQALCAYWRSGYDWRRFEDELNALGQYQTDIDGLSIHFLHIRSPHEGALPLIMTHGWPGSIAEFINVIGPLTNPTAHGGRAEDAFHLVIPSLPGFGFSGKPTVAGFGVEKIAACWVQLMQRLGYNRWAAQGGDWGAGVTTAIGKMRPEACVGIHLNFALAVPDEADLAQLTPRDVAALTDAARYQENGNGYARVQSTRPQSIAYGLTDSPSGQAAWIYEKIQEWSDSDGDCEALLGRDAILDNIMLYWLSASAGSSARLYWESFAAFVPTRLDLPVGISIFPKEIIRPARRWAEKMMSNIIHWNELERGGHFAAWEQPHLFVQELRQCFSTLR